MASIINLRFEHYHLQPTQLHVTQDTRPRLSWSFQNTSKAFNQQSYDIEVSEEASSSQLRLLSNVHRTSSLSRLVPWPLDRPLHARKKVSVRVRAWNSDRQATPWSVPARLEIGLLSRVDWSCERIAAPWGPSTTWPDPEQLYRKEFSLTSPALKGPIDQARLYITAQGVYEAEINGQRVGDVFMAPGWTAYDAHLQYQSYDVTTLLVSGVNCLGVRVAEGWFTGRIGFEGGHRNIWGPHTALMAQLEVRYADGREERVVTDESWQVTRGPIRLAEIYDGEKYDARLEMPGWSSPAASTAITSSMKHAVPWEPVLVMASLPITTKLITGFGEPVRRVDVVEPVDHITTPSGKTVIDFGQNLVGYVRLKNITGSRGHQITLSHVEVLEKGEIATRPLRICKAVDIYTLKGDSGGEQYEPRFTFHGFRYVQVDGWNDAVDLDASIEAVVCHTDMKSSGYFTCSDPLLNKLYQNIRWGMRGNFLSVPTDCPQRDERLGWTGDLAMFVPAASLIYDCFGMLKNWLVDVEYDQTVLGGVPAMVTPNSTIVDPIWCRRKPCAIWHDVTILAPWELYNETGDVEILAQRYESMRTWIDVIPRRQTGATNLWDPAIFQLGDWLDPMAPVDTPWKSATDAQLVANAFLTLSLSLMTLISCILGRTTDHEKFSMDAAATLIDFQNEYVSPNGRLISDSQTAYALAICFDLLTPAQAVVAGDRLKYLVHKNEFRIGTGFAGTPFLCEALVRTGHTNIAYAMLLEKKCPSWLYPVTMGATTMWERWDSLLPDGSVNPGEMTSFNHYAFGAIAKFLHERVGGLRRLAPGWTKCCFAPLIGAEFEDASVEHVTPFGLVSCSWETKHIGEGVDTIKMQVSVPYGVTLEVVIPQEEGEMVETVGMGVWVFESRVKRSYEWPIKPLPPKS